MIEKIIAEIHRLKKELKGYSAEEGLDYIESYIRVFSQESGSSEIPKEIEGERKKLIEVFGPMNGEQVIAIKDFARHFAEWGEHHAKEKMRNARRTEEAYQEVAEDMRKQISGSSEIPKDLEEAAEKYVSTLCDRADEGLRIDTTLESAFKAGAEWQKEQYHFFNEAWADNMQYQLDRNYENGKQDMKEQMMKEAVEGIVENWSPEPHPEITIPLNPEEYSNGDKVRVIVLKKED